ncbi:MAG: UPF0149 family protein [Woeseia sp.]|nr:UPF0149 family protein [Woeseia sp.]MBT8097289.1 UPF0149 family protein [Woeseia sp.]NNE62274.1 UPF0149 family protein [Woeseia sp.]NNL54432.1 UPF0149 family protein [Woeseia sp.]
METTIDHDSLNEALRRSGSTWEAAQAHGLLCSRLAAEGPAAGGQWLAQVLEGLDSDNALLRECEMLLDLLFNNSYQQLAGRQSDLELLLPDDQAPVEERTIALAHWCEGFLHGLVSGQRNDRVRDKLATEPLAEIIKDLLQITRAEADVGDDEETNEHAYAELVEHVRVSTQLAYEELAGLREEGDGNPVLDEQSSPLH